MTTSSELKYISITVIMPKRVCKCVTRLGTLTSVLTVLQPSLHPDLIKQRLVYN